MTKIFYFLSIAKNTLWLQPRRELEGEDAVEIEAGEELVAHVLLDGHHPVDADVLHDDDDDDDDEDNDDDDVDVDVMLTLMILMMKRLSLCSVRMTRRFVRFLKNRQFHTSSFCVQYWSFSRAFKIFF